jgi:hypothetical protein
MTAVESALIVGRERCPDYDYIGGRCQLVADHSGVHAAGMGGTCMTWRPGETQYWRMFPAPHWLIELAWMPGFQPAVHQRVVVTEA